MKKIGIITIHKIFNYGSVLQAFALQEVCRSIGTNPEIIDYDFPNEFHKRNDYGLNVGQNTSSRWLKMLFYPMLFLQHLKISFFVKKYLRLSKNRYSMPEEIKNNPPLYDVYITGSDQLWNPQYCNADPIFFLDFVKGNALKISYASSFGVKNIPEKLIDKYSKFLFSYDSISVREKAGAEIVKKLIFHDVPVVVDPTLLLNYKQWNSIVGMKRIFKKKYILCYFLNYTFNAFPYVDAFAQNLKKQTGYDVVYLGRPPENKFFFNTRYFVDASPMDFVSMIRDAELILTTSFHCSAFALNYGKPFFAIIQSMTSNDSRLSDLLHELDMQGNLVDINMPFPDVKNAYYDVSKEQNRLNELRLASFDFLKKSVGEIVN